MLSTVFEPTQLPKETICPSVAFAKGQIGDNRGQSVIYYNINMALCFVDDFIRFTLKITRDFALGHCSKEI